MNMESLSLSNMKLVMFIGCETAKGGVTGANLPRKAVLCGAETAIKFTNTINCEKANEWTLALFQELKNGVTIQEAISTIAGNYGYSTGLWSVVICGNKNLTLS